MTGLHVRKANGDRICDDYINHMFRNYSPETGRCIDCHTLMGLNPSQWGDLKWKEDR